MRPYYQDDSVTLYHGDCREWLAARAERSFDAVITDPPFDARTHEMAKSNRGSGHASKDITFRAHTHAEQVALFAQLGRITRRWVVTNLSTDTAFRFELDPPPGLQVLRVGAWIKTNPMPIISADRPAMGWEPLVYLHRVDVKPSWNDGGRACNWHGPTSQGSGHPTQKPIQLIERWVTAFTNPGDLILDPFAGSGTTLLAAKNNGRRAVGIELDERYCEIAANRLTQDVLDFEGALRMPPGPRRIPLHPALRTRKEA